MSSGDILGREIGGPHGYAVGDDSVHEDLLDSNKLEEISRYVMLGFETFSDCIKDDHILPEKLDIMRSKIHQAVEEANKASHLGLDESQIPMYVAAILGDYKNGAPRVVSPAEPVGRRRGRSLEQIELEKAQRSKRRLARGAKAHGIFADQRTKEKPDEED